jgi:hypothetical protein
MDMMSDFSILSLSETTIPEFPELPFFLNSNSNSNNDEIIENETVDTLLINIYSITDYVITFDELQEKLIEYYFYDAPIEMINNHLNILINNGFEYLYEKIINVTNDNLSMVMIEFINSSNGTEYLKSIYDLL